jgi:hypothetical protein
VDLLERDLVNWCRCRLTVEPDLSQTQSFFEMIEPSVCELDPATGWDIKIITELTRLLTDDIACQSNATAETLEYPFCQCSIDLGKGHS